MRGIFSILLVLVLSFSQAQSNLSNVIKHKIADETNLYKTETFLVKGGQNQINDFVRKGSVTLNYRVGDIFNVTCTYKTLSELTADKSMIFAELPQGKKQPLNDTMLVRNRIVPAKTGQSPLMQAYDGSGIVIGFIDTGIDFNPPDFKDSQGNSRIRFLWDQVATSGGSVPQPFNYGRDWTDSDINNNQCTHNDLANFGHGTHVAGIGAGNGKGNNTHTGVASGADIIAVAIDFNKSGPTTLDAVQYILTKAAQLGKPCVINASIGDYYGSHDATDLEAQAIEGLVALQPGIVMVAAAGNAGGTKFHVKSQPANDTVFTWLKKNALNLDYWTYADTTQIKNVQFSIGANRANFSDVGRIQFNSYNYALSGIKSDTLFNVNNQRIGIIKTSASINASGVYELYMNISADTSNLFWRVESKGTGIHHAWNFDFVSAGIPSPTTYPFFAKYIKPDTLLSMVSGFQCSDEIVTVANYNNVRYHYDVNNVLQDNNLVVGEINGGSSLGPTRDGRQKPDIAATGQMVFSTIPLSMLPNLITNAPHVVAQGSLHVRGGGTSAASPVVAGVAALYLQKNPTATNRDFKRDVTDCAFRDPFTGTALPDFQWGHGKVDGFNTLICHANLVGIKTITDQAFSVYPNPFSDQLILNFENELKDARVAAYSIDGREIFSQQVSGERFILPSESIKDYQGLLFLRIKSNDFAATVKVVKE